MKTVEEKAKEFRKWFEIKFIEEISEKNKIEVAFCAGYEAANRWRNVNEELPEIGQEIICKNRDYKSVIILDKIHRDCLWLKTFFTHWRPIE